MTSWHGILFYEFEKFWRNLKEFCYLNRTMFEIIFIVLYSFEQAGLILSIYLIRDFATLNLVVSFFVIGVLTTFTLHKLLMESRIKRLEKDIEEARTEKINSEHAVERMMEGYRELEKLTENIFKEYHVLDKRIYHIDDIDEKIILQEKQTDRKIYKSKLQNKHKRMFR